MKKFHILLLCFLAVPSLLCAHMREKKEVSCSTCCAIRAPMEQETEKPITESERDGLMFTNFIGIVVNFVKIFLDPHNIPEAKQCAFNILGGIYNLAGIITRSDFSPAMQEKLIQFIIEYCKQNNLSLTQE